MPRARAARATAVSVGVFERRRLGAIAATLALLAAAACRWAQLPVPDDLLGAEHMSASGRQGFLPGSHLRFGPFAARDVSRSWTTGREQWAQASAEGRYGQRYAFRLREGELERWSVECRTGVEARTAVVGRDQVDLSRLTSLVCTLSPAGEQGAAWLLTLEGMGERALTGHLLSGSRRYRIEGTHALAGSPFPLGTPSGYYVLDGLRTLAAVEVLNKGSVYLAVGLPPDERLAFAAAAAALLLFDDLSSTVNRLEPDSTR